VKPSLAFVVFALSRVVRASRRASSSVERDGGRDFESTVPGSRTGRARARRRPRRRDRARRRSTPSRSRASRARSRSRARRATANP
jgi:hypothetical protein